MIQRRDERGSSVEAFVRRGAAAAITLALVLTGCSTGVQDEKGWRKALERGYPCAELLDIAEGLPSSVDPQMVADDLRRAGCEPPPQAGADNG